MNKIVKGALSVCCAAVAAIGLASCSGGASAYEIAVKNGYEGTESQWLEHIQGDDGKNGNDLNIKDIYEEARKEGYARHLRQMGRGRHKTARLVPASPVFCCCLMQRKPVRGSSQRPFRRWH